MENFKFKKTQQLVLGKFIKAKFTLLFTTFDNITSINPSTIITLRALLNRIRGELVDATDKIILVCETSVSQLYKNDADGSQ